MGANRKIDPLQAERLNVRAHCKFLLARSVIFVNAGSQDSGGTNCARRVDNLFKTVS
jgi:hypothetical protein